MTVDVVREDLADTAVQRLVVVDPKETDHHVGEVVGYLCAECHQADETLDQIWHREDCSLAGEHGRAHYDDLEPDNDIDQPDPELRAGHPITVIEYGETEGLGGQGFHEGEVVGFRCDGCGNADEDVFEIVHDETCGLAGRHGRAAEST